MIAIVKIAGKQFKVSPDALVRVPRLREELGKTLEYDTVLFVEKEGVVSVGSPYVPSARVSATVFAHDRTKKQRASVYKRRKQYRRTWGFRENFTILKVKEVHGVKAP